MHLDSVVACDVFSESLTDVMCPQMVSTVAV